MSTPVRIQRKRTKGWRMPPNTVSVTRPGKWGNPYRATKARTPQQCVNLFEQTMSVMLKQDAMEYLKGKNLACFCPLDQPCHADVLLKIANQ